MQDYMAAVVLTYFWPRVRTLFWPWPDLW